MTIHEQSLLRTFEVSSARSLRRLHQAINTRRRFNGFAPLQLVAPRVWASHGVSHPYFI